MQCNPICCYKSTSLGLASKVDYPFCFDMTPLPHFSLGIFVLALQHLVLQMCRQFLHQHRLQGGNQIHVGRCQTTKQSHDHVFLLHGFLQIHKLIHNRFDLVDMVQYYVVFLLDRVCEELAITKMMLDKFFVSWMLQRDFHASAGPLQLLMYASWLFVVEVLDGHPYLMRLWYYFNTLGSVLEDGAFSYLSTMPQRSMKIKIISNLKLQRLSLSP